MIKKLKAFIIGTLVFTVVFTFIPTGNSASQVISGFKQMSATDVAQQGSLVNKYTGSVYSEEQEAVEGMMPAPEPGRASGLWGTTEDIARKISASSCSFGVERAALEKALDHIGEPPKWFGTDTPWSYENWPEGAHDPFLGEDGYGVIRYAQSGRGVAEPWVYDSYNGTDYNTSACGLITTANAISTLTKRWVNPMELVCVLGAIDQWSSNTPKACPNGYGSGAFSYTALANVCNVAGLPAEAAAFDFEKLDNLLEEGGILVCVMHGPPYTTGAHYIMIYGTMECSGDKCYLVSTSVGRERSNNHGFPSKDKNGITYTYTEQHILGHYPKSLIERGAPNQCVYIHVNKDLVFDNTNWDVYAEDTIN